MLDPSDTQGIMTEGPGPVVPAWLLGGELRAVRILAGKTQAQAAERVNKVEATVRRWEAADVIIGLLELRTLCDFYGVSERQRGQLEKLRESAQKPGWWNGHGTWPDATIALLGMEQAAVGIRAWDMTAIPGLLQTSEMARLILQTVTPSISRSQLDADVALRIDRQNRVFDGPQREMTFIIDEYVFARMPGSASVRQEQIAKLLTPPRGATIRVLPFNVGLHPALGSFIVFHFDSARLPAGVYVGGSLSAKGMVQTGSEVSRYEQVMTWLENSALSPSKTRTFLREKMESLGS